MLSHSGDCFYLIEFIAGDFDNAHPNPRVGYRDTKKLGDTFFPGIVFRRKTSPFSFISGSTKIGQQLLFFSKFLNSGPLPTVGTVSVHSKK